MADLPATARNNLPDHKKAPVFPVDRDKLAQASGRPAGSGYHANLDNVKKLILAVKVGYTKMAIDMSVQNPTVEQVFEANSAEITFRLSNALGDLKTVDGTSLPLPLVNNENNRLWAFVQAFVKDPAKYGAAGFKPVQTLKPIGKDSTLAAPSAPPAKK